MADFTALKNSIRNYIKQNGNAEITGEVLQNILISMVVSMGDGAINGIADGLANEANARTNADGLLQNAINSISTALGDGYTYAGIATPATTPTSGRVFYLALQAGTYTNFGGIVVTQGINILKNNDGTWQLDNVIGIDDIPTAGSPNLVKSGGAFANMGAFDISDYNKSGSTLATYADLTAALAALPSEYQKGGMSVKFIQSSDNKYVQYRLMADEWSTTVDDWQGVDDKPTTGSVNIAKSGGTVLYINEKDIYNYCFDKLPRYTGTMNSSGIFILDVNPNQYQFILLGVKPGDVVKVQSDRTYYCAFLRSYEGIVNMVQADIAGEILAVFANVENTLTAPSEAACLYLSVKDQGYKTNTSVSINGVNLGKTIPTLFTEVTERFDKIEDVKETNVLSFTLEDCQRISGLINSDSKWAGVGIGGYNHISIPVKAGDVIEIKNPSNTTLCAFTKSTNSFCINGETVDISGNLLGAFVNTTNRFIAPNDAKYFIWTTEDNGVSTIPSSFKINGLNILTSVLSRISNNSIYNFTVDVNGSGDFTSLRDCMIHIGQIIGEYTEGVHSPEFVYTEEKIDKEFNVYIKAGVYDVRSYFTNEEWNAQTETPTTLNVIGLIIPRGVNLIGLGKKRSDVVITCTSETSDERKATLNIQNDVKITNLTVEGIHTRYVVHDDFSYYPYSNIHGDYRICEDVDFIGENLLYNNVYGAGTKGGADWTFKNCRFINKTAEYCWSTHDRDGNEQTKSERFNLINCQFIGYGGTNSIGFKGYFGGCEENVSIVGCMFKGIRCLTETNGITVFNISGHGNTKEWTFINDGAQNSIASSPKFSDEVKGGFNVGSSSISYGDYVTLDANGDFEKSLSATNYKALEDISVGTFGVVKQI